MDFLLDPLNETFLLRALIELLLLAAVCGPLGVWVMLFGQSYAAESLAHAMLPGLVLASLAGAPLVLGAAAGGAAAAGAVAMAGRDERIGPDVAVGVVVTALFGAGVLLALNPESPQGLRDLLFGDLLGVDGGRVAVTAGLVAVLLATLAASHRGLALAAFDPSSARALGTRPGRVQMLFVGVLALTVVTAVQTLGNVLVVAMLIAPAAAALRLELRLSATLAVAAGLAALSGVLGLYASYHLETAGGASVALAALAVYAMSLAATGGRRRSPAGPPPGPAVAQTR